MIYKFGEQIVPVTTEEWETDQVPAVFVTDQVVIVYDDTVDLAGRDVLFDLGIIDRPSPREHTGEYDREDQDQYHAEHDPEQYFGWFTHDNSLQINYCYI